VILHLPADDPAAEQMTSWPGWPPGLRPERRRKLRFILTFSTGGFANPSDEGGLELLREFCDSRDCSPMQESSRRGWVSPSQTFGGLSERQRAKLAGGLNQEPRGQNTAKGRPVDSLWRESS
jgi:hypothetical protein